MNLSSWMREDGPQGDIVLGTRIRLARNLKDLPFPPSASREQLRHLLDISSSLVDDLKEFGVFQFYKMAEVADLDRQLLMEKHLVSPDHIQNTPTKGLLLAQREDISIMVNEEDHFRIQVLFPGLQLDAAYDLASRIDDCLGKKLDFAFDQEWGYLTACPTNVGTGMRASVMVHLPALGKVNRVRQLLGNVAKFGLVVRGLYGEGSDVAGNIYQISNQVTLGHTEKETIEHLLRVTSQVISGERQAREYLLESGRRLAIEDSIYRSYGILANARIVSGREAMELLSDIRLGIDLQLIKHLDTKILKELMVLIRPAHLQKYMGQNLPEGERDRLRASLVREKLAHK